MDYLLKVEHISKHYNRFKAVSDVSFSIPEGRLFGLLGPNGAGKTTIMRMIMNIIIPDKGQIILFGEPFKEIFKDIIGYLPEERGLYLKMSVIDHLQFLGEMKGRRSGEAKALALKWLNRFQLTNRASQKIQELSKGLQQKVQFIGTILHMPRLLIVDEPFSGLDPLNTKFFKDTLLELKKHGTTIILSTHLMDQAEKLCDDLCLINHGKVILQGNPQTLKKRHGRHSVMLEYSGQGDFIPQLPFVESSNAYGNYIEVRLKANATSQQLFRSLAAHDIDLKRFESAETSLNNIFIEMVGSTQHENH